MKIVPGVAIKKGMSLKGINMKRELRVLSLREFTGYLCISIRERSVQDGLMIFNKGRLAGGVYEYIKYKKIYHGMEALKRILNAFISKRGVIDIYGLDANDYQRLRADLKEAMLDKEVTLNEERINKMLPENFNPDYELEVLETTPEQEGLRREKTFAEFGVKNLILEEQKEKVKKITSE